ncbi:MAG TPA: lipid A export permease/ATP-binding protein MsbA [Candidatus Binatia bacterium]|nr:lipid A export permease/ATP-binding protein MsbA [Candidatus Binatia bacterium]
MTVQATPSPSAVYRRLLTYSLRYWPVFLAAISAMALMSATEVSFMALVKPLLDEGFWKKDPHFFRLMPLAVVGLFFVRGVSSFAANYSMVWIARRVVVNLRGELFNRLLLLPVRFFDRQSAGQLISRLTYNVEQVSQAVTQVPTTLVRDSLTTMGMLAYMAWVNWRLAVFCFAVAPLIGLIIQFVARRFRSISRRIQDSVGNVTEAAEEAVTGQRVIKIHNGQEVERRAFQQINERNRWLQLKLTVTQNTSDALIQFIASWAIAAILYFIMQPDQLSAMTPGSFVSFMGAMLSLRSPLKNLSSVNEPLQRGVAAATVIFQLIDETPEPVGGTRALARARGAIEFRDVRFRYADDAPEALRGVSLKIEPGQTVAFVGRSGSGKSTLLSLLPRFYDPQAGEIRLDGHDLRDYPVARLRAQLALVDQQVRLFNATVAENIAYGLDPPPPEAKIVEAARAAYAWDFIEKLPGGLQAPVGHNGVLLSGGQRQRIAIARALLRDAPLLILDEATSALDTESERYIQQALARLVEGRTTLVIAHRLSTVQSADLIVVMQDGQIAESGRHDELLARNGLYAALYRMQFEAA